MQRGPGGGRGQANKSGLVDTGPQAARVVPPGGAAIGFKREPPVGRRSCSGFSMGASRDAPARILAFNRGPATAAKLERCLANKSYPSNCTVVTRCSVRSSPPPRPRTCRQTVHYVCMHTHPSPQDYQFPGGPSTHLDPHHQDDIDRPQSHLGNAVQRNSCMTPT